MHMDNNLLLLAGGMIFQLYKNFLTARSESGASVTQSGSFPC